MKKKILIAVGLLLIVASAASGHSLTDTSKLDDLANAITLGNGSANMQRIKTYAQAQAAATQSQEVAIEDLQARVAALEGNTPPAPGDTTAPSAPSNLRVTASSDTSIAVAWNASTDNIGVTGYRVFRGTTQVNAGTALSYSDSALACGTSYTYGVEAFDAAGNTSTRSTLTTSTASCPAPTPTGYPDASNTGIPAGTALTDYTGPANVTVPNTVIDGKIIKCIDVSAPGVVIRNSLINGTGCGYSIFVNDGGTPLSTPVLIQDSEITCNGPGTAIGEADITAQRVNIHNCENGFDANRDITVRDSYIHDLYQSAEAHPDGFQSSGHYEGSTVYSWAKNLTIVHNTIYATSSSGEIGNAAMIFGRGGDTNILIQNNLFAGGGYTVYCEIDAKGTNFRILDNAFSTKFSPKVGYYGPSTDCADETQSGNYIYETGQPITLG